MVRLRGGRQWRRGLHAPGPPWSIWAKKKAQVESGWGAEFSGARQDGAKSTGAVCGNLASRGGASHLGLKVCHDDVPLPGIAKVRRFGKGDS